MQHDPSRNADSAASATATPAVAAKAVFLDPSGHRWLRVRVLVALLAVAVLAGMVTMAPRVWTPPALDGRPDPRVITSKDTGLNAPVVGTGPLVRVLEVRHVGGRKVAFEPFTGAQVEALSAEESSEAGNARYVIQRYGQSSGAAKTIALTFDDGPSPGVTPKLLDVLSANKVPATFFVIGKEAAEYPDIVARMVREGHAVGNHTLTHADIAQEPSWRAEAELILTDRVLRATTGEESAYWRAPYEGGDEKSEQETIDAILTAQRLGYAFASHDFDTNDWAVDSSPQGRVEDIAVPDLDSGKSFTMLLHDAGGPNRMRTVEYVKRLIPYAEAHGYTFVTMPAVQPTLAAATYPIQTSVDDSLGSYVVKALLVWPDDLLSWLFVVAVVMVLVVGFLYATLAWARYRRRRKLVFPDAQSIGLGVSVVLAAYNERPVIARTLRAILASDYPILEVIVVDDGSTDGTDHAVRRAMAGHERVVLLRQPNSGKAAALNHGVERARGEIVLTLDADTVLAPDTVTNLVRHFALPGAQRLGAVAGVVRVGNRRTNLLTRWQALEYLTQIAVERAAQDSLGAISIIPGACAAWRKQAIQSAGGYSDVTLAEDCDLALTMHRLGWTVTQDDEALAYTEAPETVDDLLAQRTRWTFGTLQAIWKHRAMLFNPRFGALGWFVLPNYVLSVAMPLVFLPLVAAAAWTVVEQGGWLVLGGYFGLFVAAHMVIAAIGVRLMRERFHHVLMVPVYRVVYEPLRAYLLYTSALRALKGVRMTWKKLIRTGSLDGGHVPAGPGETTQSGPVTLADQEVERSSEPGGRSRELSSTGNRS